MKSAAAIRASAIGLVLAVPVAAWWLIGDPTPVGDGIEYDYAYRAVSFGATADRAIGVLACVAVVSAVALLAWATVTRRLRPGWWLVLAPLVVAGLLVSVVGRVMTEGVIGANIGGGLMMLAGGPVLAILLASAALVAWRLNRTGARLSAQPS
ncbi:hypothetical protein [Actinoplanes regularis]|uniref:hypothetical protein n=1 Tax=Actinoplanes regularis TaxID=52697 RepID=UPI002555EFEC|nr:hypothetical protein [Actinoplanes regularis]